MLNNKKQMSFGLTKKTTNKVEKTKADVTLMETKTLPCAKEDHSKDKDKEENTRKKASTQLVILDFEWLSVLVLVVHTYGGVIKLCVLAAKLAYRKLCVECVFFDH